MCLHYGIILPDKLTHFLNTLKKKNSIWDFYKRPAVVYINKLSCTGIVIQHIDEWPNIA